MNLVGCLNITFFFFVAKVGCHGTLLWHSCNELLSSLCIVRPSQLPFDFFLRIKIAVKNKEMKDLVNDSGEYGRCRKCLSVKSVPSCLLSASYSASFSKLWYSRWLVLVGWLQQSH